MQSKDICIDLTEFSTTLPDPVDNEIPLDSTISAFARQFGAKNECMILVGPNGSGKTTHLSQFVRQFPTQCFSYFLQDNIWVLNQSDFLFSLCNQMNAALGNQVMDTLLDVDRLKTLFGNLCQKIIEKAKRQNTKYYFVVDGLDYAFTQEPGECIIDLLPLRTHPRFLYFFGGIRSDSIERLQFSFYKAEPHLFSLLETQTYLVNPAFSLTDKKRIHNLSGGAPGYLFALQSLVSKGESVTQILDSPSTMEDLVAIQWKRAKIDSNEMTTSIYGLIAFSLVPLEVEDIAKIIDISEKDIKEYLTSGGMIKHRSDGGIEFQHELLKRIAREKLNSQKTDILRKLIRYYEGIRSSSKEDVILSQYYIEMKDYPSIAKLLAPSHLVNIILDQQDLAGVRRSLKQACELAAESNDLVGAMKFGLAVSSLHTVSDELIGESEVMALVSLGHYEGALHLAYSSRLLTMRIALLSRVYSEMQRKGEIVPSESITEIKQMAQQIGKNAEPKELIQLAISMFPLLPDTTIELLEQAQLGERSQGVMDVAIALASLESDSEPADEIVDKIQDTRLRDLAVSNSPWLVQLSIDDVLEKSSTMKSTEAKEYLLRQWCLQNRSHEQLHEVLHSILDMIISDTDYSAPLRNLRQLASLLVFCRKEHRESLSKRFDVPNITGLRVPIEERVRLELCLSESLLEISENQAFDRFIEVYSSIDNREGTTDLDVICYCYIHILITQAKLDPDDSLKIKEAVMKKVNECFIQLLESSADHFDVSKRILRAFAAIDFYMGITLANMLNTKERREKSLQELVVAHMNQQRIPVDVAKISKCLLSIESQSTRDNIILRMLLVISRSRKSIDCEKLEFFVTEVTGMGDPLKKSDCLAMLIGLMKDPSEDERKRKLFNELIATRSKIDITWQCVESAFNQVKYIAASDKSLAGQIYDNAKSIRDTSSLANQTIGNVYFRLISIAARVAGRVDLSVDEQKNTWNQLLDLITTVPSRLLQVRLIAQVALSRYRRGDKRTFDSLMRDHVLPVLQSATYSELYCGIVVSVGAAVFEYSRSDARCILNALPYDFRQAAWRRAAQLTLANACIGDPIDDRLAIFKIDAQIADKTLEIIKEMSSDTAIYSIVSLFTRAIENTESPLNEAQRLDILVKLDNLIDTKLPDMENIQHDGYKLVSKGAVARTWIKVAKKAKKLIKPQLSEIIKASEFIPNIADRAIVSVWLAEDMENKDEARKLAERCLELIPQIPNAVDRIDRLEAVANLFSQLNQTPKAQEIIRLALSSVTSVEGISREQAIASLIQTAHSIDSDFAAQLTERIESQRDQLIVAKQLSMLSLAKSPDKLVPHLGDNMKDVRDLPQAAHKMLKMLVSNRGVLHTDKILKSSLTSMRLLDFDEAESIAHWVAETIVRRATEKVAAADACSLISSVLANATILYDLGNRIAFLSTVPNSLKVGFQGLSTSIEVFKVGERDRAVTWIERWLQENARSYIKIYDPYFDVEQLWLLQYIPIDIPVTLGTTWNRLDSSHSLEQALSDFKTAWSRRCSQNPPPTLIVIENSEQQTKAHDRYIVTDEGGLAIGTSFNGMGNKEFTINNLTPEDALHIERSYVDPRLDLSQFTRMTFFKL